LFRSPISTRCQWSQSSVDKENMSQFLDSGGLVSSAKCSAVLSQELVNSSEQRSSRKSWAQKARNRKKEIWTKTDRVVFEMVALNFNKICVHVCAAVYTPSLHKYTISNSPLLLLPCPHPHLRSTNRYVATMETVMLTAQIVSMT